MLFNGEFAVEPNVGARPDTTADEHLGHANRFDDRRRRGAIAQHAIRDRSNPALCRRAAVSRHSRFRHRIHSLFAASRAHRAGPRRVLDSAVPGRRAERLDFARRLPLDSGSLWRRGAGPRRQSAGVQEAGHWQTRAYSRPDVTHIRFSVRPRNIETIDHIPQGGLYD
jgi:hypothetical protein